MSSTPYIVLEKLGEGTYATVHKVSEMSHHVISVAARGQPGGKAACTPSRS